MSTTNDPRSKKTRVKRQGGWPRHDGPFRFSVDQAYQLADLGFFEDRRVELLEGILYEMTSKTPHAIASELVHDVLRLSFGIGWRVRVGLPLELGGSLPEPDFAVLAGSPRDLRTGHPTSAALVIEISDATLRKDRKIKAHVYARAGLPDYWIVNLVDRQLEVHRNPGPDPTRRGRFLYNDVTIVPETGSMAPLATLHAPIAVRDLLP